MIKHEQTWGWSDVVDATSETDAGLRRKVQRGQVEFEGGDASFRTTATLWDIATIRIMRRLCDLNFEPERAFGIARSAVNSAYRPLKSGKIVFNADNAETQQIVFLAVRQDAEPNKSGVRIIRVDPTNPDPGKREILTAISDIGAVLVPVQRLLHDAWYSLPNLPDNVARWLRVISARMQEIGI